jgi:hypothetical protein
MTTEKGKPRARLTQDVYRTAERVAEIINRHDLFPEAYDLIQDILCELAGDSQVWVDHPDFIRPFLVASAREGLDAGRVGERFLELRQACGFAGSASAIKDLRRRLRYRAVEEEQDETPAEPDETPDAAPRVLPAHVVDLSCWIQSHPRPVRNLLFAEKGGAS